MEFYRQEERVSQKERVCEMCGKPIHAGEKYSVEVGKYFGDFFQRFLHLECRDVIGEFCRSIDDSEFDYDEIADWWEAHYCNGDCKYYFPKCEPDSTCETACSYKTGDGKCTIGDTCHEMTRICWCEKYEK